MFGDFNMGFAVCHAGVSEQRIFRFGAVVWIEVGLVLKREVGEIGLGKLKILVVYDIV